jgi:hypothetical protein
MRNPEQGDKEFQERIGRIEGLLKKLDSAADPAIRRGARQLVEALMELHGAALERMLELICGAPEREGGEAGGALIGAFGSDPLISSLLVLYGLHPEDLETRVRRGLENVRTVLQREGVHWEALRIENNIVQVKIVGSRDAAHARRMEEAVREALLATAPDAGEVRIASASAASVGFVPLAGLRGADGSAIVAAARPLLET